MSKQTINELVESINEAIIEDGFQIFDDQPELRDQLNALSARRLSADQREEVRAIIVGLQEWDEAEAEAEAEMEEQECEEGDDEEENERPMKEQLKKARAKYVKTKNYAGEASMDNGDPVATLLRGLEPGDVCLLADKLLGEEPGHHQTRYQALNPGQQRMNAGNKIRGAIKRGDVHPEDVPGAYKELGLVAMAQEE